MVMVVVVVVERAGQKMTVVAVALMAMMVMVGAIHNTNVLTFSGHSHTNMSTCASSVVQVISLSLPLSLPYVFPLLSCTRSVHSLAILSHAFSRARTCVIADIFRNRAKKSASANDSQAPTRLP